MGWSHTNVRAQAQLLICMETLKTVHGKMFADSMTDFHSMGLFIPSFKPLELDEKIIPAVQCAEAILK